MSEFSPDPEFLITDGAGGFFCGTKGLRLDRKWHGWFAAKESPRNRLQLLRGFEICCYQRGHLSFNTRIWSGSGWTASSHPSRVGMCSPDQNFLAFDEINFRIYFRIRPGSLGIAFRGADQFDQIIVRPLFVGSWRSASASSNRLVLESGSGEERNSLSFWSPGSVDWRENHQKSERVFEWEKECEKSWEEDVFLAGDIVLDAKKNPRLLIHFEGMNEYEDPEKCLPDIEARELIQRRELLDCAADQFLVRTPEDRWTIMAGYPWFTDWGRDTMIALRGLCLLRGREDVARDIIDHFLAHLDCGLIPNIFPEGKEKPRYNTIDGTLWMFDAIHRYTRLAEESGNSIPRAWNKQLYSILEAHFSGTHEGIIVDSDGLLRGGSKGSQLTWMDVKVDGHVPTPRHGKPVEIQALWNHALSVLNTHGSVGDDISFQYNLDVAQGLVAENFVGRFVDADRMLLADVVDRDKAGTVDWAQRPNQIIPFAFENNPIPESLRGEVLRHAGRHLLTPRGLRSLAPGDAAYHGIYRGPVETRDRAYHQGTVWMWLLIPWMRGVSGHRHQVPELFEQLCEMGEEILETHFLEEGCYAQANEIFDGDSPHTPRGCFAQAWSVAALVELEDIIASG